MRLVQPRAPKRAAQATRVFLLAETNLRRARNLHFDVVARRRGSPGEGDQQQGGRSDNTSNELPHVFSFRGLRDVAEILGYFRLSQIVKQGIWRTYKHKYQSEFYSSVPPLPWDRGGRRWSSTRRLCCSGPPRSSAMKAIS